MEKYQKAKTRKSGKIVITLFVMSILITLSGIMVSQISAMEEQACWDALEQTAQRTAVELRRQIDSDQELLESIATIITGMESLNSSSVQKIIDEFQPHTMISHIALLLPGDQVMLPKEPVRQTNGILSFEEEAALGTHISNRSVDIRDERKMILRNFVPILKNGETAAMLYGVVDLQTLPEKLDRSAYSGNVQITIMDAESGDYLVDTWHNNLGNVNDFGERKLVSGQSLKELSRMALEGESGYSVFLSETIGENLYFYSAPAKINHWSVGIHVPQSLVFARMNRVNRMLFGFMGAEVLVLAGYFLWILMSTKKELLEKQRLADTDLLTGLKNRNCYEKNIPGLPAGCKESLACIYVDANGLHELNNTKGHAAGDKMLREVAKAIQTGFGDEHTYRIGGDEFVAFAMDSPLEVIREKLAKINASLTGQGYHVSIGICSRDVPVEVEPLIKQAEAHMYEEKRKYYEQAGRDRRNRR